MSAYNHFLGEYNQNLSTWTDGNSQAMGIINQALEIRIWDQSKAKTAKESWD